MANDLISLMDQAMIRLPQSVPISVPGGMTQNDLATAGPEYESLLFPSLTAEGSRPGTTAAAAAAASKGLLLEEERNDEDQMLQGLGSKGLSDLYLYLSATCPRPLYCS